VGGRSRRDADSDVAAVSLTLPVLTVGAIAELRLTVRVCAAWPLAPGTDGGPDVGVGSDGRVCAAWPLAAGTDGRRDVEWRVMVG